MSPRLALGAHDATPNGASPPWLASGSEVCINPPGLLSQPCGYLSAFGGRSANLMEHLEWQVPDRLEIGPVIGLSSGWVVGLHDRHRYLLGV